MSSEFDFSENLELFKRANELTLPIVSTNERYDQLEDHPTLKDEPEFMQIAADGLKTEQKIAFNTLKSEIELPPYEKLYTVYGEVSEEIDELTIALESVRDRMTSEQRRYDDLVEAVKEIAPLGEKQAEELAERRKSELELAEAAVIREEISVKQSYLESFDELIEESGKAWPIPRLLNGVVQIISPEYIDEIPVDPQLKKPSEQKRFDQFKERHVYSDELTTAVIFYLVEESGNVVTVDELAKFVYGFGPDEPHPKDVRTSITSALGPKTNKDRIEEILGNEGDGYVLQYGWRRKVDQETGIPCGARYRIYRALDLNDIDAVDDIVRHNGDIDSFDGAESDPEYLMPEKQNGGYEVEDVPEVLTKISEPEIEDDEAEAIIRPVLMAPRPTARTAKKMGAAPLKVATKKVVSQVKSPEKEPRANWQSDLSKAIGEAITLLEADKLMTDEPLAANIVSIRSSSTLMGTQTALERMEEAGIISLSGLSRNSKQKFQLSPAERVIMSIFNTQSKSFTERSRKRQALKLVDDAVASFFEKHS